MKSRRYEGTEVRIILTAMITETAVLSKISGHWRFGGLFDAAWANLAGQWCVEYYQKFQTAPGRRIQRLFELWAIKNPADDKVVDAVSNFLQSLSDDYDQTNSGSVDHTIEIATNYFNRVQGLKIAADANIDFENDLIESGLDRYLKFRAIDFSDVGFYNFTNDIDLSVQSVDEEDQRPLVRYPGELGEFTSGCFCRGEFYSFVAPDKTGKSTYLRDFIYRALRQRNNVAFWDLGDARNIKEVHRYFNMRASWRPRYSSSLWVPKRWDGNEPILEKTDFEGIDGYYGYEQIRKVAATDDSFRAMWYKNSSCSVAMISDTLEKWKRDGWRVDVVGLDYADILARPKGMQQDKIEAIAENWRQMRVLSQYHDCLVMTATQSKASGYRKTDQLLGPEDFSGSKEKNAHVNGMLGINVSPDEKQKGVGRINWCPRREGESNAKWYCRVAGNFAIRNPIMISKMG